jgi:CcmD family protein
MKLDTYRSSAQGSLEALTLVSWSQGKEPAAEPGQRSTEFRAVEGSETMSGETLLVEAYAAIWIILFVFIVASWRKQSRIDARVDELERAVARVQPK